MSVLQMLHTTLSHAGWTPRPRLRPSQTEEHTVNQWPLHPKNPNQHPTLPNPNPNPPRRQIWAVFNLCVRCAQSPLGKQLYVFTHHQKLAQPNHQGSDLVPSLHVCCCCCCFAFCWGDRCSSTLHSKVGHKALCTLAWEHEPKLHPRHPPVCVDGHPTQTFHMQQR